MIVKICGIRTLGDAVAAVDAGADMLGFNFYEPSPRFIPPAACAGLVGQLRASGRPVPALAGVFVNATPGDVLRTLDDCGLDYAQLSGDEPVEDLAQLGGRAFKAIRPGTRGEAELLCAAFAAHRPPRLLLDASRAGLYGGTGVVADWSVAAALARRVDLMLAGGLDPHNVGAAVRAVQPWGVDVASGVESAPGVKDAMKMRAFVAQAKAAAAAQT